MIYRTRTMWAYMPVAVALTLGLAAGSALAGGTLRIAMTASDVPTTTGAPDNGYEGVRFLGYPVFEGLVLWDLKSADKLADIRPGLAERWEQDPNDKAKWIFHLRKGVKFHDGSDFNADAAIWNLDRYFKKDAKQFDPPGGAVAQARNPFVASYRKIDDNTIEITNPRPLSYFPNMLPYMLYSSPAQFEKTGSWAEFAKAPSGTGPFKITEFKPRVSVDAEPERRLLGQGSRPQARQDGAVPDAGGDDAARRAALGPGRLDRGAAAGCRAEPEGAGFEIVTSSYPHMWPWVFNLAKDDSPWKDVRVRRALNYCVDREGLVTLLNGLAEPSVGVFKPADPSFGKPEGAVQVRSGEGQGAAEGGRLRPRQAGQGQDHDLDQRLGPDVAAADERVPAAEPEGVRLRHLLRGGRVGHHAGRAAQRADGAAGARLGRHEHQPAALDRHLADRALVPVDQRGAQRPQLGQLEERGVRHADRPDREVERQGADPQGHPARARDHRRRSALGVHRPRPQPARDDQEGQRLHQRAELVPGLHERGHGMIVIGVCLVSHPSSPSGEGRTHGHRARHRVARCQPA